jgi:hypothetical protein
MFEVTCLVDPRRIVGTPRKLGPESPKKIGSGTTLPIAKQTQEIHQ